MTGTFVNAAAILVGGSLGLLIKRGLPQRVTDGVMKALGLVTIFIGILGAIKSQDVLAVVLSIVVATVIGSLIDIDKGIHKLTDRLIGSKGDNRFSEGFVTTTLLFITGAMAVTGAMNDGINGDSTLLITKAVMDGVSALIFAAALGMGVLLSAVPVLIYQGGIALLSGLIAPVLSPQTIVEMGAVGSILVIGVGINLIGAAKIKVFNSILAIFLPILYFLIKGLF
ncbi:MAG: DUF554 domain-containing protein [Eubacteriales bacterium]|nr:DUF554 domain-containing protein [Eubacteriales bacterium]